MDPARNTWPAGRTIDPKASIDTACEGCGEPWRIHENMAGFRFQCSHCSAWVTVPQPEELTALQASTARALAERRDADDDPRLDRALMPLDAMERTAEGLVALDLPEGRVYEGDIDPSEAVAPGTMRHVRSDVRRRFTSRTILEIGAMMAAILVPYWVLFTAYPEDDGTLLMPFASLIGGVLVILIGFAAPKYTFGGLRAAGPRYWVEAIFGAAVALLCAWAWTVLIKSQLGDLGGQEMLTEMKSIMGPVLAFCVIAVTPAIVEELAFRGLLQGRMTALMDRRGGILAVAGFFALAHGISLATPLHMGLGVYLGFLRDRSGSLLPGMLLHLVYNGAIVLLS